jgi:uncharacterized NAD(P)/FAD-binding protein YdhS
MTTSSNTMPRNIKEVVIIGDGFTAAVMVIHLLRLGVDPSALVLLGSGELGKGSAYNCVNPFFRLNVREDLPSVFSEDPLHFARWAEIHIDDPEAKTDAGYFYRRSDFGRYMFELVAKEAGSEQIERITATATNLYRSDKHWHIETANHGTLVAKKTNIATGNPPPVWPCHVTKDHLADLSRLIENPWSGHELTNIDAHEEIILLGGGLTALDAINALVGQAHRGMIKVIGPRAIFPPSQALWRRQKEPKWPQKLTPAQLVNFMRKHLPCVPTSSIQWQSAWEELRPNLNSIWQRFSSHQRRILFKRLGWLWSLYRFRASPQTISSYKKLEANNQIRFILGHAQKIDTEQKVRVLLDNGSIVEGDRIINCTGVGRDPFLSKMILNQTTCADALGQSIAVDAQLRVMKSINEHCDRLWMIGPATMASLGDVIAASSIAKQAEQLALELVRDP